MDSGDVPISIFPDLSKAFDTLDHDILLDKLSYYGVKETALSLLKSYLSNRKQYVEYLNTTSNFTDIKTGVPQGSILGPLLFIIFINDFTSASTIFSLIMYMYADDTTLCSTLNAFKPKSQNETLNDNINKELCEIDKWLKLNKLSLDTTKSKFIIFHMPQKRVEIPIININNVNIECVANFDFSGVTIDKKLSWNGHTDKISLKLSRCVGILNKLKRFLPQHIILTIYNSMFLPHINYCILAWGYNHQRIFKIQKKVVRIISLSKYNAQLIPYSNIWSFLKWKIYIKFYHKLIINQTPKYFTSLDLVFNFENHEHNTRRRNYITHRVRREYANLCVRNSLPYLLNNTDQIILNKTTTHSLHGFAIYIKNSILNTYKDECNIDNCYICLDRPL